MDPSVKQWLGPAPHPGHTELLHGGLRRVGGVRRAGVSPQGRRGGGSEETTPAQPLPPPMLTLVGPAGL